MGNLISKVWWFNPNDHTTHFELHAMFTDNTTSVYVFRKVGTSWEPTGEPHDDRLVIMLPGKASLNDTYRMIPIGYSSGDWSYIFTTQN